MKQKPKATLTWIILLAALFLGSACLSEEAASGPTATPQVIVVTATPETGSGATQEQPPDATLTPTVELVTMTAGQDLSCVKGPHWIFYEWVARIYEGDTVTLLAKASEDWEEYYYVRMDDGTECWAFGGSSTKTGDPSLLPVREAPPLPEINFLITNQTGLDIGEVYIREQGAGAWGANRISALMHPGDSISVTLIAGYYDLRINDFTGGTLMEKYERPIGAEQSYSSLAVDEKMEFFIQNNHSFTLCEFRFRRVGFDWETLHTASDGEVAHGERATFLLLPARYDIEIYRCTGPLVDSDTDLYFGPSTPGYTSP